MDLTRFDAEISKLAQVGVPSKENTPFVLLYGSSTFTHWGHYDSQKELAPFTICNRGFGGSTSADALYHLPRLVLPLKFDILALYEGDNDQVMNFTPEDVYNNLAAIVRIVRSYQPKCKIVILGVKPSPSRVEFNSIRLLINKKLQTLVDHFDQVFYLDLDNVLLDSNGYPNRSLYLEDMLHLNKAGYEKLASVMKTSFHKAIGE